MALWHCAAASGVFILAVMAAGSVLWRRSIVRPYTQGKWKPLALDASEASSATDGEADLAVAGKAIAERSLWYHSNSEVCT